LWEGGSGGQAFSGGTQYSCDESDENEFSEEALMKKKKIKSMTQKEQVHTVQQCTVQILLTC